MRSRQSIQTVCICRSQRESHLLCQMYNAKRMERKTIIQKCLFLGVDFKTKIE